MNTGSTAFKHIRVFFLLVMMTAAGAGPAVAGYAPCGSLKNVTGNVTITRDGQQVHVSTGDRIYPMDRIVSGPDSSVGIILQDDTIVCLGPESTLDMEEFHFDPSASEYSLITRMLKGTFLFVSGLMAKLSPDSVKVSTPDGTIAVRGTRFLVEVSH